MLAEHLLSQSTGIVSQELLALCYFLNIFDIISTERGISLEVCLGSSRSCKQRFCCLTVALHLCLKQKLSGTKAYKQNSEKEKSVINNHIFHNATSFAVSVNEDQQRLPTFYWLANCTNNHIRLDLLLILAHARLPNYQNC